MFRSCAVFVGACFLATAASPPPPSPPRVLLSAPVNATWAANHLALWKAKGVDGFLLHGIFDICEGDIWGRDGAPETRDDDDGLLLEVRAAQRRLRDGGIGANYLSTALPENFQGFEDSGPADSFIRALHDAAVFCAGTGLPGIALDTQSSSLFYYPRWDGYVVDPAQLHAGARALGRRIANACAAAGSEAALLLLYDGPKESGPLWGSLWAGLHEGAQRVRTLRMHVLTRGTFDTVEPAVLLEALSRERAYLDLSRGAGESAGDTWSVAPGLRPLMQPQAGGEVYAAYSAASFRVQLAAAKLRAPHFVWIESSGQTWWQVQEAEAAQYAGLFQLGAAVPQQTKPIPPYLEGTTAATPLDSLIRVMHVPDSLAEPSVLAGEDGAAMVLWPGQSVTLEAPERPRRIVDLASGAARTKFDEGEKSLAATDAPLLVQGLSVAERVLAASLWLDVDERALARWDESVPLHFGFTNHTPVALRGAVDALTPARWLLGRDHQEFELGTGEGIDVATVLRGPRTTGSEVRIRGAVIVSGAIPRGRDFVLCVPPRTVWDAMLDAPAAGPPVWSDLDGDGTGEVVVATTGGDLVCIDAAGTMRWGYVAARGFAFGPLVGRAPAGWPVVVAVDARGTLHFVRGDGTAVAEADLGERPVAPPVLGDLHTTSGDELVVALTSGSVQAWRLDGSRLWEHALESPTVHLSLRMGADDGRSSLVCTGADVAILDSEGTTTSRAALSASASTPAIFDTAGAMVVGSVAGQVLRITEGNTIETDAGDATVSVGGIAIAPSGLVVATTSKGIFAYDATLKPQWSSGIEGAHDPMVIVNGDASILLISVDDPAGVVCMDLAGTVLWRDASPLWGPVSGVAGGLHDRVVRYMYGASDRMVRVREFRMGPP